MIRQYLSNTNESITISTLQKFLEVNKALDNRAAKQQMPKLHNAVQSKAAGQLR